MSFFSSLSLSISPHRRRYRDGHYGSGYYQRRGVLGNLVDAFLSRSDRHGYYDPYVNPPQQVNIYPGQQAPNQPVQNAAAVCGGCGAQIPAGSKFCLNCGAKVAPPVSHQSAGAAAFCPNCGDGLPPNARFCQKCGIKLNQ